MDADLSCNHRYHFRSNNDRIKVRTFSPDRSGFRVEIRCGLRVYAVTGRNKSVAGGLSVLVAAQIPLGIYSIIRAATVPSWFLDCVFVRVRTHRPLVLLLPNIDLDVFKTCIYGRWRLGELLFANTAIVFGTPPTLQPPV